MTPEMSARLQLVQTDYAAARAAFESALEGAVDKDTAATIFDRADESFRLTMWYGENSHRSDYPSADWLPRCPCGTGPVGHPEADA